MVPLEIYRGASIYGELYDIHYKSYYLVLFLLGAGFTIQQIKNDYPSGSIFFLGLLIISLIVLFLEAFRGSPTAMNR